ncbi:MAG: hypothetical protein RLZZ479_1200 [Bacteroidota bacterium]|jgi:hypothetical protein
MAKSFSFSELDSALSKINPKGSIITHNTFSKIDEYIPTGNFMLNAQLTGSLFGGIPNSRSICFAGESGCLPKNEKVKVYILKTRTFDERYTIEE